MSSSAPRVSVIVTTYNRAPLLVQAIDSVLAQAYRDFELLVADDGSTDDTAARLAGYGNALRYLPLEHRGRPEDTRNQAILASRGELIAFLDDDDLWRPDKLARQVPPFDRDERLGLVYSDARLLYQDGSLSAPALPPHHKRSETVLHHLLAGCFIHPSTVVVRRRLFDQLGLFESRFLAQGDYYFWLRAAWVAPVFCVPEPLVHVRRHASSLALERGIRDFECAIEVLEYLLQTTSLKLSHRWQTRRTLARWHTHVGLAVRALEPQRARRYFVRSLRLNPFQRRAWAALGSLRRP